jgi:hypothetical protein
LPRTAASIISRAGQKSKTGNVVNGVFQGYTAQALDELNDILDHIAQTIDFAAAMATFNFTFNTELTNTGSGNIIQASPNPLPLDYLRVQTSGGSSGAQRSSKWYLDGVPYDMVEIDLTEWDDQVQQAGIQSYPYFWAKDMSQRVIVLNTTGDLATDSVTVANLPTIAGLLPGMSVAGTGIVPGTTVLTVGSTSCTLSQEPLVTQTQVSLMFGYPPVGYPYPPPSGAYNARIRYQKLPPPLTQAQVNAGAYAWFDDSEVLTDLLTERMMGYSDDARAGQFDAFAAQKLARYTRLADDRSNRATVVELDRRRFGGSFRNLPNSKRVGW